MVASGRQTSEGPSLVIGREPSTLTPSWLGSGVLRWEMSRSRETLACCSHFQTGAYVILDLTLSRVKCPLRAKPCF